jgi:2-amino-4-hydroxy-6-hydroxymethyldihydropteridine diphosphokinase
LNSATGRADLHTATTPRVDVYVGIGSNIEPEYALLSGVEAMRAQFGELCISPVYRSPALGFEGDDFLNVVVCFRSGLDADAIETRLNGIEHSGNFSHNGRFAPRGLDCDLLMYGSRVDASRRLPRDDVLRYPFVLGPLADIAPQLRHPLDGRSMAEHWARRGADVALQRVCDFADLKLPADAAAAVDGEDLSGHISRVPGEI